MKTFDVLTVTRRAGWELMALASLEKQTVRPGKWIIISERPDDHYEAWKRSPTAFSAPIYPKVYPAPERKRPSNLNASLNYGLQMVRSDYVIFYQDFIELPVDCFERLLALADERTFVTTCTPNYDGSNDSRYTGIQRPRPCEPKEWEANVAIAPMAIIRELGGFDEEYDEGWSWDNVNLAERAAMLGCKFIIDESNRPRLWPHDKQRGLKLNGDFHSETMEKIRKGEKPLRLHYLNDEN